MILVEAASNNSGSSSFSSTASTDNEQNLLYGKQHWTNGNDNDNDNSVSKKEQQDTTINQWKHQQYQQWQF